MMLIDALKRAYPSMLKCKVMSLEYDSLNEERFTPKPHNLPWWCRDIIWHYFGRRLPGHLSRFEMVLLDFPIWNPVQRAKDLYKWLFTDGWYKEYCLGKTRKVQFQDKQIEVPTTKVIWKRPWDFNRSEYIPNDLGFQAKLKKIPKFFTKGTCS